MSIESAKAFIERMKTDEEFNNRVSTAKDKEARMALVKAEGFDFTKEEIGSLIDELDDEQLDAVAGGVAGWTCDGGVPYDGVGCWCTTGG